MQVHNRAGDVVGIRRQAFFSFREDVGLKEIALGHELLQNDVNDDAGLRELIKARDVAKGEDLAGETRIILTALSNLRRKLPEPRAIRGVRCFFDVP